MSIANNQLQKKSILPGYKQTPFGIIPDNWEMNTIGKVIKFSGGSQPALKYFKFQETEGYVRLIQTRDYRTNKYKTFIPKGSVKKFCTENDIMIGRYGPPIFQIFKGLSGAYNVALIKATPLDFVNKDYCYYFLCRPELRMFLEGLSQRSGGQTGVEIDKLNEFPFPIPPLPEQQKIATILFTWDLAIDHCKAIIEKLKERNRGLAQQLLTGKMRVKGFEGTKWVEKKADKIFKSHTDKTHNGELEILSATQERGVIPRSMGNIDIKYDENSLGTYKKVEIGDYVISLRSFQGGIEYSEYEGIVSPAYTILKEIIPISKTFYKVYFKTETFINRLNTIIYGIRDGKQISFGDFATLNLPCPAIEEQEEIAKILITGLAELNRYHQKLQAMQLQKKGLMQQLLTGKTRVKIE